MEKERFSLLLLEPNEIYFEDFSAELHEKAPDFKTKTEGVAGRLKMCSKSLLFDPKDTQRPIIKIPYKDCLKISLWPEEDADAEGEQKSSNTNHSLVIRCNQFIEILDHNVLAPYKFISNKQVFFFTFDYVKINDYILQLCQLKRASSLHAAEQNSMIATIVFSRHSRVKFNPLWLNNIYEKIILDGQVDEINPLVLNPGRLVLTDSCIYFQAYNNIQPYPVIKIKLGNVINLIKRRFLLRHTALEIRWKEDKEHIFYISFRNSLECNNFYDRALEQNDLKITHIEPESMTLKWQNRIISNYDYLLYLNSLADRTVQDLTQYPVFPWVIKDYESDKIDLNDENVYRDLKNPIGALNEERLQRLRERCEEMGDPKFLYGSHYSAPGLVLFYLVRKYPHLMLCLQNGRFDHPDRMFNKISDTFNNCLTNMSDFKELIPEFYDTEQKGDFLLNTHKVNFGNRNDGSPVNHVILPPWANSSPENFIQILRDALESDYVSKNLHHWIDLIFGYKQRGPEALKADNLFYYLCYEGSVDLDNVHDQTKRHALEVQISEFGQIPKQLFDKPHIARHGKNHVKEESPIRNFLSFDKDFDLKLEMAYVAHKDVITSVSVVDDDILVSTGKDGLLKCFKISQQRQIRSVSFDNSPIGACIKIPNSNILVIGSWDNTIFLYNFDYGKVTDVIPAHDDAVSSLSLIPELGFLISGSWDCSVKIWKGFSNVEYKTFRISDSMVGYLPFEERVLRLTHRIHKDTLNIFVGTEAGEVFSYELNMDLVNSSHSYEYLESKLIVSHGSKITGLSLNSQGTKLATCDQEGYLIVTDINTGMNLLKKLIENAPFCLDWCDQSEMLLMGNQVGNILIWDLVEGELKCDKNISNGPVNCVRYSPSNKLIITAGKDDSNYKIKCWSFN